MKTTTLTKKLLLFLTFLVLWSCEKDKLSEPVPQETNTDKIELSIAKVNLEELPSFIMDNNSQNIQRKRNSYFGVPKKGVPVYVSTNHKGYKSYTIALTTSAQAKNTATAALYFDNWVINTYKDGAKKEYIIRYAPTEEWYYSGESFKTYSGKIIFYSTEGKKVNSVLLHEGHMQNKSKNNLAARENAPELECEYVLDHIVTICSNGGSIVGEENTSTMECIPTYYIDLQCYYDLGNDTGGGTNIPDLPTNENGGNPGDGKPDGGSDESPDSDGSGWTPPIIEPLEIIDVSELDNPCLKGVYNNLNTSAIASNYLLSFEGQKPVAHLKFTVGVDPENPDANAVTYAPDNYWIEIKFNPNKLNRPRTSIARTFIHEIIHAEIYRKLLSAAQNDDLNPENMTRQQQIDYVNSLRNDFPGLYDYYIKRNKPNWDHEMMAQHYRGIISDFLIQFDPSLTQGQADALAWVGLAGTVTWNNLTVQEQTNIDQIVDSYNLNNPDC